MIEETRVGCKEWRTPSQECVLERRNGGRAQKATVAMNVDTTARKWVGRD